MKSAGRSMLTASKFRLSGSQALLSSLLERGRALFQEADTTLITLGVFVPPVYFEEQGWDSVDHGRSSLLTTASLQRMQHANACVQQAFRLNAFRCFIAIQSTRGRLEAYSTPVRQDGHQTVKQIQPLYRSCRCLCTAAKENAAGGRRLFLYSKDDCPLCDGYKVGVLHVLCSSLGRWSLCPLKQHSAMGAQCPSVYV